MRDGVRDGGPDGDGPDPGQAVDVAEFIVLLGELRAFAGNPPFRTLAKQVGPLMRPPQTVTHSTVADVFQPRRRRLDMDLVTAIVRALGEDEQSVARWREACVAVHAAVKRGGPAGVLRQLPADSATFTGREANLRALLDAALAPAAGGQVTVAVSAIEGMAGVGKTQLAVHAAHELVRAGRYTDVQLYVNLRGFDADRSPADPAEVLDAFLRALDVPGARIPDGLDARAAMFRDRMHGKDALLLLDNAADEKQVRELIPAGLGCLVLVTSRRSLAGLDGVVPVSLDVFDSAEAVELLARIAGPERVRAEPEAAARIVEACGFLPLAVALAAARLRARPAWMLADLAGYLSEGGLDALSAGGRALRQVLDLSYQGLSPDIRRIFCLLGLHFGADITAPAVAALADVPAADARRVLELLQDEHLLQQKVPGRYELHDLLRVFAVDRVAEDLSEADREAAFDRLLAWYLNTADAAGRLLRPRRNYALSEAVPAGPARLALADPAAAQGWLDAEHPNLKAALHRTSADGHDDFAARMPVAMWELFNNRGLWDDWITACTIGVAAARRLGDARIEMVLLIELGPALAHAGRHDEAADVLRNAAELCRDQGDVRLEATARVNLGMTGVQTGRFDLADEQFQQALVLHRSVDNSFGEASVLDGLAHVATAAGDPETALRYRVEALKAFQVAGDRPCIAGTMVNIGCALVRLGRSEEAAAMLRQGIEGSEELGFLEAQGTGWEYLGEALVGLDDLDGARDALRRSRAVYSGINEGAATRVAARLAELDADPPS